jgi:hypothetical protein
MLKFCPKTNTIYQTINCHIIQYREPRIKHSQVFIWATDSDRIHCGSIFCLLLPPCSLLGCISPTFSSEQNLVSAVDRSFISPFLTNDWQSHVHSTYQNYCNSRQCTPDDYVRQQVCLSQSVDRLVYRLKDMKSAFGSKQKKEIFLFIVSPDRLRSTSSDQSNFYGR